MPASSCSSCTTQGSLDFTIWTWHNRVRLDIISKLGKPTLFKNSLLFPMSCSNIPRSAVCCWISFNTLSSCVFVNWGGGSEKVTEPEAEISAQMSFDSIWGFKNSKMTRGEKKSGRHNAPCWEAVPSLHLRNRYWQLYQCLKRGAWHMLRWASLMPIERHGWSLDVLARCFSPVNIDQLGKYENGGEPDRPEQKCFSPSRISPATAVCYWDKRWWTPNREYFWKVV